MAYEQQWIDALAIRTKLYVLMQQPITLLELSDKTGMCYRTVYNHIIAMTDAKGFIKETPKMFYRGRTRVAYIATQQTYNPPVPDYAKRLRKPQPVQEVEKKIYTKDGITKVSSNDYDTPRREYTKRSAWSGYSSWGLM